MKTKLSYPTFTLWVLPNGLGHTFFISTPYDLVAESVHELISSVFRDDSGEAFDAGYFLIKSNRREDTYYHIDYSGSALTLSLSATIRTIEGFRNKLLTHTEEQFNGVPSRTQQEIHS